MGMMKERRVDADCQKNTLAAWWWWATKVVEVRPIRVRVSHLALHIAPSRRGCFTLRVASAQPRVETILVWTLASARALVSSIMRCATSKFNCASVGVNATIERLTSPEIQRSSLLLEIHLYLPRRPVTCWGGNAHIKSLHCTALYAQCDSKPACPVHCSTNLHCGRAMWSDFSCSHQLNFRAASKTNDLYSFPSNPNITIAKLPSMVAKTRLRNR